MSIRVIRFIEYIFHDEKVMADHLARLTVNHRTRDMEMRSAILSPEHVDFLVCDRCSENKVSVSIRNFCKACGPTPFCDDCAHEHFQVVRGSVDEASEEDMRADEQMGE